MIDKLTLNNEIVAMRKVVRQARVHVIGKLVREIKKLRACKGDDALKAKRNRKAERRVEVLMVLKKLNPDVVSKFALKNKENAAEKFGDPDIGIEERALYKLTSSKVLADRVNQFRVKYPDWEDFIYDTLEELGANRKKNPPKNGENVKNKMKLGRADKKAESHAVKSNDIAVSSERSTQESNVESDDVKVTKPLVELKSNFNAGWAISEIEPGKVKSIKNVKESATKENKAKVQKKISPHDRSKSNLSSWNVSENKKKGAAEIRKFSELVSRDIDSPVKKEIIKQSEVECDEEGSPKEEAVDPFFMTSDGTGEYRTNIKTVDINDEDVERRTPFSNEWGGRNSFNDRGRGRDYPGRGRGGRDSGQFKRGSSFSGRGAGQFGRGAGRGNQFSRGRGGNKDRGQGRGKVWNDSKFQQNPALSSAGDSQLHPSWEAKRKQKEQSITNVVFQGKKIKFDDD